VVFKAYLHTHLHTQMHRWCVQK